MKKRIIGIISLLLIAVLTLSIVACGSKGAADNGFSAEYDKAPEVGSSEIVTKPTDVTASNGGDGSKIIKSASITAETKEYADSTEALKALIASVGGHISNSSASENASYNSSGKPEKNANYTVKIPSQSFDSFIESLSDIFNITNLSTSTVDVSESYFTLQARIDTLQAKREGLVSMLKNVDVNTDFTTWQKINSELTEIDTQLNIYNEQLKSLENQVAYSTVTLSVREVVEYTEKDEKNYGEEVKDAFVDSFESVGEFFKEFLLVLIAVFPFLLIWGAFVAIVVVIVRISIKKKRARNNKNENDKK